MRIIARFKDGRQLRGQTYDFERTRPVFHLMTQNPETNKEENVKIMLRELKGIFFVKSYKGDPDYRDKQEFTPADLILGKKIKVIFNDGEEMLGTTMGCDSDNIGFFILPADRRSNNEKVFVVWDAVKKVSNEQ